MVDLFCMLIQQCLVMIMIMIMTKMNTMMMMLMMTMKKFLPALQDLG